MHSQADKTAYCQQDNEIEDFSNYLSKIGLEIRTPLTSLIRFIQNPKTKELTYTECKQIETLKTNSLQLLKMINYLMVISEENICHEVTKQIEVCDQPIKANGYAQLKILLVEDDPIIQKLHSTMLQKMNCSVDLAKDGYEALDKITNDYDLIIMDIGLPGMNGIETTKKIRACHSIEKYVPIFALTAYSGDDISDDCLYAGMDAVATKPISFDSLKNLICIASMK